MDILNKIFSKYKKKTDEEILLKEMEDYLSQEIYRLFKCHDSYEKNQQRQKESDENCYYNNIDDNVANESIKIIKDHLDI